MKIHVIVQHPKQGNEYRPIAVAANVSPQKATTRLIDLEDDPNNCDYIYMMDTVELEP